MGTTTNAYIAYGIPLEEGDELPWDEHEDIESWWREVSGYKPIHKPFTSEGDFSEGWSTNDARFAEHFEHVAEWDKANPMPVQVENTCSGDYPIWLLAVPNTEKRASRGYPSRFTPEMLIVKDDEIIMMLDFIKEQKIDCDTSKIGWHLFSYYSH